MTCTTLSIGRRRTIPVVVTITDLNDNGPVFQGEPYAVTVPEVRRERCRIAASPDGTFKLTSVTN